MPLAALQFWVFVQGFLLVTLATNLCPFGAKFEDVFCATVARHAA
jgi:hypothetical protein